MILPRPQAVGVDDMRHVLERSTSSDEMQWLMCAHAHAHAHALSLACTSNRIRAMAWSPLGSSPAHVR